MHMLSLMVRFISVLVFVFVVLLGGVWSVDVSTCQSITSPGYYRLVANLTPTTTCFYIQSSDVIFDMNGNRIDYFGITSYAFYIYGGLDNITIRNGVINGSYYAVYKPNTELNSNITIEDLYIDNSTIGIIYSGNTGDGNYTYLRVINTTVYAESVPIHSTYINLTYIDNGFLNHSSETGYGLYLYEILDVYINNTYIRSDKNYAIYFYNPFKQNGTLNIVNSMVEGPFNPSSYYSFYLNINNTTIYNPCNWDNSLSSVAYTFFGNVNITGDINIEFTRNIDFFSSSPSCVEIGDDTFGNFLNINMNGKTLNGSGIIDTSGYYYWSFKNITITNGSIINAGIGIYLTSYYDVNAYFSNLYVNASQNAIVLDIGKGNFSIASSVFEGGYRSLYLSGDLSTSTIFNISLFSLNLTGSIYTDYVDHIYGKNLGVKEICDNSTVTDLSYTKGFLELILLDDLETIQSRCIGSYYSNSNYFMDLFIDMNGHKARIYDISGSFVSEGYGNLMLKNGKIISDGYGVYRASGQGNITIYNVTFRTNNSAIYYSSNLYGNYDTINISHNDVMSKNGYDIYLYGVETITIAGNTLTSADKLYVWGYYNLQFYDIFNGSYIGNNWDAFVCSDLNNVSLHYNHPWVYYRCDSNDYASGVVVDPYPLVDYPTNVEMSVEDYAVGEIRGKLKDERIINFTQQLRDALRDCVPDVNNTCLIRINLYSDSRGRVKLSSLNVLYNLIWYETLVRVSSRASQTQTFTNLYLSGRDGATCNLLSGYNLTLPSQGIVFIKGYCPLKCEDLENIHLEGMCGLYDTLDKERIISKCEFKRLN